MSTPRFVTVETNEIDECSEASGNSTSQIANPNQEFRFDVLEKNDVTRNCLSLYWSGVKS